MTYAVHTNVLRYGALLATLTALAAISGFRSSRAHNAAQHAQRELEMLLFDAATIAQLRGQEERIAWKAKPEGDLLAHVNAILAEAGVSSAKLGGVSGEAVTSAEGTNGRRLGTNPMLRKQTMCITLIEMSPMELGMFLTAWRDHESVWSIDQMELQHARTTENLDMYDCRILVAAWFHEHETAEGQ